MKRIFIIAIVLLIIAVGCCLNYNNYIFAHTDRNAPEITILDNNITIYESDSFDINDYFKVSDDSGKYTVNILNEEEIFNIGEKVIEIEAIDESGNKSKDSITINMISNEEWNHFVIDNTYNYTYRNGKNDELIELKGYANRNAFEVALNLIGMKGGCNVVSQAFIDSYFGQGFDILDGTYPVTLEEAKPGDIIYYTNGGLGEQHIATYLGGASALHGNINGTTVIGNVYMSHGSTPQFRRLNGIQ